MVVVNRIKRAVSSNLKTKDHSEDHIMMDRGKSTIEYNLDGVFNDPSSARSARLIKPLSCLECIRPLSLNNRKLGVISDIDIERPLKVLCIGPRTEAEILLLWAYGFKLEDITSIDLISYSDLISLQDMHRMEFDDSYFDVVFSSCTLVYSTNISKAVNEIKRVAKTNALYAISQDIPNKQRKEESIANFGVEFYSPRSIVELFFPFGEAKVHYSHFVEENLGSLNGSSSSCIFSGAK